VTGPLSESKALRVGLQREWSGQEVLSYPSKLEVFAVFGGDVARTQKRGQHTTDRFFKAFCFAEIARQRFGTCRAAAWTGGQIAQSGALGKMRKTVE
jgi:hypothetical protein